MTDSYNSVVSTIKEAAKRFFPFYNAVKQALSHTDNLVWFSANSTSDTPTLITDSYDTEESLRDKGFAIGHTDQKLANDQTWVYVKKADFPAWRVLHPITQAMNLAPAAWNKPLGEFGTSPLASMLTSGLLGGGLGYMGGALAEHLLPEDIIERGKLRKTTAILGALAGAAPPAYLGTVGMRLNASEGKNPWKAWIEPNTFFGAQKKAIHSAYEHIKTLSDESAEEIVKQAFDENLNDAGLMHLPFIPVDAFNRTVMMDPYATLPLQIATAGLTEAANQAKGNTGIISPYDIARIGVGMGAGLSQAYLGGKVLGALAGLTPQAQKTLQQAGMFAGALKAVVPGLFGK